MWDGAYGQARCRRCQRTPRCRFRRLKAAIAWWLMAHWWPIRWAGSLLRLMSLPDPHSAETELLGSLGDAIEFGDHDVRPLPF